MGKVLCFVPKAFADYEIVLALHLLRDVGHKKIVTVGYSRDPVTALSGMRTVPDITFDEAATLDDIDAFLMPGGPLCERNELLVSFIQKLNGEGKLLAAICFGPQYLARSGLLANHRYTTSCTPGHIKKHGIEDPFPREQLVNERVVTDGDILTAQGHAFVDFAFSILAYLGYDPKDKEELEQYHRDILNR